MVLRKVDMEMDSGPCAQHLVEIAGYTYLLIKPTLEGSSPLSD